MKKIFQILIYFFAFNLTVGQTTVKTETLEIIGGGPEVIATYPGGFKALTKYVAENVTSKITLSNDEVASLGKMVAKFTITENGSVDSVFVIRSSNNSRVDNLFIDALTKMPKWTPGTIKGKPVRQQFSFPLTICLKGN